MTFVPIISQTIFIWKKSVATKLNVSFFLVQNQRKNTAEQLCNNGIYLVIGLFEWSSSCTLEIFLV